MFPRLRADIEQLERQHRFAVALALTRTTQDVKAAEEAEMREVFDRPTDYTMRALRIIPATKDRLEASVELKDDSAGSGTPPEKYLSPQIEGGSRVLKRFERALQAAGAMLPGYYAVPGRFARLDAFGNVSRGQIIQILSQLRITLTAGYTRNISTDPKKRAAAFRRAGGQYFALPTGRGKLLPGIYQARDTAWGRAAPRPVFIFVRSTTYRRRFDFDGIAERTAQERFPERFEEAMELALRTGR
jgi:hypothetical protein